MPAKKKAKSTTKKKTASKKATKKKAAKKKTSKKASTKKSKTKKAAAKKTAKKISRKQSAKTAVRKAVPETQSRQIFEKLVDATPTEPPKPKKKQGIDCEHCEATGVCAAGTPYDPSHGQMFGAKLRMTSCVECLLAAGEHKNSKKLVSCRICEGDGKI